MGQNILLIFILLLLTSCQKPGATIYVNKHSQLIFQKKDSLFIACSPISFINIGQFSSHQTINLYSNDIGCIDSEGNSDNIKLTILKVNNSFFLNFNDTCADNSNYSGEYTQLILEPIQWDSLKIHFVHSEEYDVIVHHNNTKELSNNSNLLDFDSEVQLFLMISLITICAGIDVVKFQSLYYTIRV